MHLGQTYVVQGQNEYVANAIRHLAVAGWLDIQHMYYNYPSALPLNQSYWTVPPPVQIPHMALIFQSCITARLFAVKRECDMCRGGYL